jgi:cation diffusion facilitator family transporter
MGAKATMAALKFQFGRRINSQALVADAWNDSMDILSAFTALVAVALTLWRPEQFASADQYGAFGVGLIVVFLGIRVTYETGEQLMDRMPDPQRLEVIRRVALQVDGARAVEKCFARRTGLRYHVDLHLEVDPEMTVRESHRIAHDVRARILEELDWVADVLVHVEPYLLAMQPAAR